ncbi:hypothetical protein OOT46_24615 [Aquabacterium sp. A7-Y]|uniref:hypothetical protein n=1 Tax=Aquabacterium sp. A7-Y TaxID=1349605 RepID=UPI00223E8EBB|nr:hypothetical protein [Aquabacterium sp. A7-Y]MCW7541009.1 hypothetical protein [Aquabacterium sp. A7-Y]
MERGIQPLVLEAGGTAGANLLAYGHVRLFSPWRYNIDPAVAALRMDVATRSITSAGCTTSSIVSPSLITRGPTGKPSA